MPYTLQQLAAGSYDLVLNGETIGSVVQELSRSRESTGWLAELLEVESEAPKPAPFVEVEHRFDTLGKLMAWLGAPEVIRTPREPLRSSR